MKRRNAQNGITHLKWLNEKFALKAYGVHELNHRLYTKPLFLLIYSFASSILKLTSIVAQIYESWKSQSEPILFPTIVLLGLIV